ncbi:MULTISPECIES: hypothetical protein [Thermomonas]|jgi:hypothetical protein|uniref:Amino acid transport protein n=1 Tax=Thermomonas beijingensis TaxID=2872701 RepID=A0ABS7TBS9_9GAMM|nr:MULTISPECIES: hypothetical protein [Thermomonas]MBS0460198.1 hypothetical protein [Pseudomonadota bacterium]MDE2381812.1 hypothetical protein [Xanthomonadaceae bacterium]MBZ4185305.1 hypothetical protein [Thermomonas beijingensis]HOC11053.1 hypothetical protein [Thermomonas sp.]HQA02148.1 hypothetical protein [Thermomonas sp.]
MSTSILLAGVLFGAVGVGYVLYGRKQRAPLPLVSGVALMVIPYFLSNAVLLFVLGIALAVLPWVVRL